MKTKSRRMQENLKKITDELYSPVEAIELLKNTANAKFVETAEAHIVLGLNPKYADQQLRATVILPHGTGKTVRVAVITKGSKIEEAQQANADIVGVREYSNLLI